MIKVGPRAEKGPRRRLEGIERAGTSGGLAARHPLCTACLPEAGSGRCAEATGANRVAAEAETGKACDGQGPGRLPAAGEAVEGRGGRARWRQKRPGSRGLALGPVALLVVPVALLTRGEEVRGAPADLGQARNNWLRGRRDG